MPWPHCNQQINDDKPCPTCGLTKQEWTLDVKVTRRFVISAGLACKVELKDAQGAFAHKARYRIELPDGKVDEGELNRSGYAKANTKLPGDALVSFPEHGASVTLLTATGKAGDVAGTFRCPVGPTKYEFKLVAVGAWLELQLLDDRGLPVADERYVARLADGTLREGRLDAAGFARLEGIPDGPVEVRYPDRAPAEWYDHDLHELELELRDAAGALVPDEPYRVRLPDGKLLEGRLDGQGRARLEGLPSREVEVAFPGRGSHVWDFVDRFPRAVSARPTPSDFLELELKDAEGRPRSGAPWRVRAADGRTYAGFLGADGTSRLVGLVPGECEVDFPDEPLFAPPGVITRGRLQLELRDGEGRGVAFAPYQLRQADGRVRSGLLDVDGRASLEGLEDCEVLFPEHLAEAWQAKGRAVQPPPAPSASLELALKDERGAPRAGARWRVRANDGRLFSGRLDAAGEARLQGLPPGEHEVDFPDEPTFAPPGVTFLGRLQLELRGTDGLPVPFAPFVVRAPDGRLRGGRLDADGRATLEGVDDGCEVQFPEHEAGVVGPEELARRKAAARAAEGEAARERAREAERAAAKAERKRARAAAEAERERAAAEAAEADRERAAAKAERKRARAEREAEREGAAAEAERAAPKPRPGRVGDRWNPAPSATPSPQQPKPQPGKLGDRWNPAPSTTPLPQQPKPQPGKLGERWSPAPTTTPSPQEPKPAPGKLGERWNPQPGPTKPPEGA